MGMIGVKWSHGIFALVAVLVVGLFFGLFSREVLGIIPSQNVSANSTPVNNTYFNTAFPNFNITFVGENLTYGLELFINSTARGTRNINNSVIANITTNASLGDGVNYTWYFNVSNGTQSNLSNATFVFTIDTTKPLITYEATGNHSLENNTNISATIIRVNVSYTEVNFGNVTFNLVNISNGTAISMNASFFSAGSGNRSVNFSALTDGTYTVNVTVTDLANNTNYSEQRTLRLDATNPLLNYSDATAGNNSNITTSRFLVNVTVTEANFANLTFRLFNGTNSSQMVNTSTSVSNASASRVINYSLADGNYSFNATVTDTANNRNITVNQFVTIDTTAPGITLGVSPTSLQPGETVTISCTASDAIDSGPSKTLSIKKAGASSFSTISAGSYTDTSGSGTYTVRCSASDYHSNTGTADKTFEVASASSSSTSGGGGSSTKKSAAEEEEEEVTEEVEEGVVDIEEISEEWKTEGEVRYTGVEEGDVYTFSFVTAVTGENVVEEHSVMVQDVNEEEGTVTIVVESSPQEIVVALGESEEVDLDGNGDSDLLVTLNEIADGVADLTFTKLGEWLELEKVDSTSVVEEEEGGARVWLWVIAGVVLLIVIVLVYLSMAGTTKKHRR